MAYEKLYERINWVNKSVSKSTPVGATNLNKMDSAIDELDNRVVALSKGVPTFDSSASGESIQLTDSTDNKVTAFALHGNATQKQYTGKNLLKNTGTNQTISGVTFTVNEDGSVTLDGTSTAGFYNYYVNADMSDLPNGTYTVTFEGPTGKNIWLTPIMNDSTKVYCGVGDKPTIEITDDLKIESVRIWVNTGQTFSEDTYYPMIRLSTVTDNTYEPYVGGIPSPNPDCPHEITVAGASGSIEVKSVGKNLLKNTLTSKTANGVTLTVSEDGSITANGTATANTSFVVGSNIPNDFVGKELVLSGCPSGGSDSTYRLQMWHYNNGSVAFDYGDGASAIITDEMVNNTWNVALFFTSGVTVSDLTFKPMLRLASDTDSTYEPYKESVSSISTPDGLMKIAGGHGNYVEEDGTAYTTDDIIKYADGTGKKIQRIVKLILDGTEEWGLQTANTFVFNSEQLLAKISYVVCDSYVATANSASTMPDKTIKQNYFNGRTYGFIMLKDTAYATVDELKAGLAAKNVVCYAVLKEPIITDLSAEELAEIEKLQTFYPTTNIINDAGCGMEVVYKADVKNHIDNIILGRVATLEAALLNNI